MLSRMAAGQPRDRIVRARLVKVRHLMEEARFRSGRGTPLLDLRMLLTGLLARYTMGKRECRTMRPRHGSFSLGNSRNGKCVSKISRLGLPNAAALHAWGSSERQQALIELEHFAVLDRESGGTRLMRKGLGGARAKTVAPDHLSFRQAAKITSRFLLHLPVHVSGDRRSSTLRPMYAMLQTPCFVVVLENDVSHARDRGCSRGLSD